jgi:hypothetical protein
MDRDIDQVWQALVGIEARIETHTRLTADSKRFAASVVEKVKTEVALLGQILDKKVEAIYQGPIDAGGSPKEPDDQGHYRLHRT